MTSFFNEINNTLKNTGSTHCSLVPYWSKKLGKQKLKSLQLSERGGEMFCIDKGDRVLINGKASNSKKEI